MGRQRAPLSGSTTPKVTTAAEILFITNVHLAYPDPPFNAGKLWSVECREGNVVRVAPYIEGEYLPISFARYEIDARGGILLPSLCHSHIHLDKCFILDRCDLISGDFKEAMSVTGTAKARFPLEKEDLLSRGRKLIHESVDCGVTSMRAHVEIDDLVGFSGLDVALHLKEEARLACHIQIAVFAQEALFSSAEDAEPGSNFQLLAEAVQREGVEAVGSAPYVEPTIEQAKKNIELIFELASHTSLTLIDFHLDYNLDPDSEPLIYEVIKQAKKYCPAWKSHGPELFGRHITIGHATRLQLFTSKEWRHLQDAIGDLPITFVGLPNSDMYMQGRLQAGQPLGAPRSTLRVPHLFDKYNIQIAMSVNNVENAFTPQGSADPLALCTFGAAIFQAATKTDIQTLAKSVTITSKVAIGQTNVPLELYPQRGDIADFVILHGIQTLRQAVLNPPYDRTTIRNGIVVAHRRTRRWTAIKESPVSKIVNPISWWWYLLFPVSWPFLLLDNWVSGPRKFLIS
ncbi:Metallo-dependent hydrolase [Lentinula edodes]|nr:Metallo-dependent hydrolase [Lentinula edodes]